MEPLKPCAVCGNPAIAGLAAVGEGPERMWMVGCSHCSEKTPDFDSIDAAVEDWNGRHQDDLPPAVPEPA
jgi:hypothetical protein